MPLALRVRTSPRAHIGQVGATGQVRAGGIPEPVTGLGTAAGAGMLHNTARERGGHAAPSAVH